MLFRCRKSIAILVFVFSIEVLHAQIALGQWRDHLPYNTAFLIEDAGTRIYCATSGGALFYLNHSDNELYKLSKANGLNDIGVSAIRYSPALNLLMVAYSNTNIDLIRGDNIINFSDIYSKSIVGKKNINNILFIGNYVFLSCGFGIVTVDLNKMEVKDQYYIGPNGSAIEVFDLTYDGSKLYAATESGIYKASYNLTTLVDYQNWSRVQDAPLPYSAKFNAIEAVNGFVYANYSSASADVIYYFNGSVWQLLPGGSYTDCFTLNSCYGKLVATGTQKADVFNSSNNVIHSASSGAQADAIYDAAGNLWLADKTQGLIRSSSSGAVEPGVFPNGPSSIRSESISINKNTVWVACGKLSEEKWWEGFGVNYMKDNTWYPLAMSAVNATVVQAHVSNAGDAWIGYFGYGLGEVKNYLFDQRYDITNSIIETVPGFDKNYSRVSAMTYDDNRNFYFTEHLVNKPLYMISSAGVWTKFPVKYASFKNQFIKGIAVDRDNYLWLVLQNTAGFLGLFVYDYAGTPDNDADDREVLVKVLNQDNHEFTELKCIAADQEGNIWVGTIEGPVAYFNTSDVFSGTNYQGNQVKIPRNDGTDQADYFLGTEAINAIAVDGANRKWFGTVKSGVYLVSADGSKELKHYTRENSPLLSNYITAIAIDPESGEVFFGTDRGIISYRSDASEPNNDFKDVYVFPNPVREDYHGLITITGLILNTIVKITDINGNLVYETKSLGGQATWDGKNYKGRRVQTGVYLVFLSNTDGSKTHMTKLLFIN